MDGIDMEILRRLAAKGRGRIFFAQEFYDLWPESTVRYSLSVLAEQGQIARLARGVFCYPRLSEHGMKMMLPDTDEIAQAIAEKSCVRIVPYGEHAAYQDLYSWIKEKDAQGAHLYINVTYQLHDTIPIDHIISVSREVHNHDTVQVVVSDGKNIMLKNYTEYDENGNLLKEVRWDQMDNGQADEEDARRICDANGVACVITYEKKEGLYNGDVIKATRSDDGSTPLAGTYLPQRQSIRIVIADNGADGQRP